MGVSTAITPADAGLRLWRTFVDKIAALDNTLLSSIFGHGQYRSYDEHNKKVTAAFAQQFAFFEELLVRETASWAAALSDIFGSGARLIPLFVPDIVPTSPTATVQEHEAREAALPRTVSPPVIQTSCGREHEEAAPPRAYRTSTKTPSQRPARRMTVDISDASVWPKACALVRSFPGIVYEGSQ